MARLSQQQVDQLNRRLDIACKELISLHTDYGVGLESVAMNVTVKLYNHGMQQSMEHQKSLDEAKAQLEKELEEAGAGALIEKLEE